MADSNVSDETTGVKTAFDRRTFLKTAAATGAAPLLTGADGKRRNIVFVLVDDLRFDAMSFMNHPVIETPHIDAMARNGVHLKNAFVTTSLCSPSRASILTGLYAHKHQILDNSTLMPEGAVTFPALLRKAGYRTGFVGKWHMGGSTDRPRPGFDRWVSFPGQGRYYDQTFNVDGGHEESKGYITDRITDYGVEFIEKNRDRPFFLYMSHKATHAMFKPAERHRGKYRNVTVPKPVSFADTEENYRGKPLWVKRQRITWHGVDAMYNHAIGFDEFYRSYCETVLGVDDSVGRLMATLQKHGLDRDTLVILMGDNGFLFGEHGLIDKRCMYEPSIRVPMIAHCPSLTGSARAMDQLALNIDIAPTILDAAGIPAPSSMHGRSFLPLLAGKRTDWRNGFLYEYFWERAFAQTPTVMGLRTDRYSFMRHHGVWDIYELYDIKSDPDQMNNLLGNELPTAQAGDILRHIQDPALKRLVNGLQDQLFSIIRETGGRIEPTWKG
ncbi:MAG: sulfatase-like hydrolase/transferase [Candidatus Latescibacteria bacterium]|nr:sulfatase-like hydrolase/transferase [Candidatus Latescibacterota bacterium]